MITICKITPKGPNAKNLPSLYIASRDEAIAFLKLQVEELGLSANVDLEDIPVFTLEETKQQIEIAKQFFKRGSEQN